MERVFASGYYSDQWAEARDRYGSSRGSVNSDVRLEPGMSSFYPATDYRQRPMEKVCPVGSAGSIAMNDFAPDSAAKNIPSSSSSISNNNLVSRHMSDPTRQDKAWYPDSQYSKTGPSSGSKPPQQQKQQQKKGVRRIFRRFAEKCSMQGPSYIYGSTSWYARSVWTLLLLAAMAAMSYHLYYLCKVYFSWPTKNTLSLGFSSLEFPAVTVCSVNPIRASQLPMLSPDLATYLQQIDPATIGGKIDKIPAAHNTTNSTSEKVRRKRREAVASSDDAESTDDDFYYDDDDDEGDDPTQLDDIDFGQDSSNFSNSRKSVDDGDFSDLDGYDDSWENEGSQSFFARMENGFQELFAAEKRWDRVRAGHKMKNMLLSCSFAGKSCYASNFTLSTSCHFGNCYTLQYSKFISRESGPGGGMELLFFLDTEEFIRAITPDDGLQVSIHQQGSVAYPSSEGMAIASATHTKLSLKKLYVQRKGQPYGDCSNTDHYMTRYGVVYSRQTCFRICKESEAHSACGCRDETEDETNLLMKATSLKPCRNRTEMECLRRVHWRHQQGNDQCQCFSPCTETKYEKTISSRPWPHEEYARNVLVKMACKRISAKKCQKLQAKPSYELSREFVKFTIFFEDLNYENITESADYEAPQFISDVGGTLGLWIGLSALSLMEVFQLFMEIIKHFCSCRRTPTK